MVSGYGGPLAFLEVLTVHGKGHRNSGTGLFSIGDCIHVAQYVTKWGWRKIPVDCHRNKNREDRVTYLTDIGKIG